MRNHFLRFVFVPLTAAALAGVSEFFPTEAVPLVFAEETQATTEAPAIQLLPQPEISDKIEAPAEQPQDGVIERAVRDTVPPTGAISTPQPGRVGQGTMLIDVQAKDNVGIQNVQILVDGSPAFCKLENHAPYTCNWDTRRISNGSHVLTAVIRDAANNIFTTAQLSVLVQNQGGAQSPGTQPAGSSQVITGAISTPMPGSAVKGTVLIDVQARSAAPIRDVQILVDGNPALCKLEKNAPYTCNLDTRKVADGTHQLSAVIRNTANNAVTTAALAVMVQNQGGIQPPAAAAATATPLSESVETSGPGNWVTWNYLAMHHPEIVAHALADVQTSKLPRTSIAGLASDVELTAMLKTDWTAEVNRLATMGHASGPQAGITPRGLPSDLYATDSPAIAAAKPNSALNAIPSDYGQVTAIPSAKRNPASQAIINELLALTLPPQNLGSVWAGQSAFAYVFITAPVDGYIEGRFNLNATNRHFRIVNAMAYSGEVVNGTPAVSLTIPGGQYQDVVLDPAHPPSQISKAGFVAILAKKGQLIVFTVAFEPVGLGMTPVGNNEATLELGGATSTDINILSPNTPVATWRRMASIRARFEGINFGVLGATSDSAITVFYDGTPCGRLIPVPASITFHNAEQQVRSVSVTADLSRPLHMPAFTVSVAPGERKQVPLSIQIDSCPTQGVGYMARLKYAYAGIIRQTEFSVTLYPKLLHWYNGPADVGYCRYSWDIYAQPDGTTHFAYNLRNTNLVSQMQLDLRFSVLGVNIGRGVLSDGPKTVHTKFGGYAIPSTFVRDNYTRLFSERAHGGLRCHAPGF